MDGLDRVQTRAGQEPPEDDLAAHRARPNVMLEVQMEKVKAVRIMCDWCADGAWSAPSTQQQHGRLSCLGCAVAASSSVAAMVPSAADRPRSMRMGRFRHRSVCGGRSTNREGDKGRIAGLDRDLPPCSKMRGSYHSSASRSPLPARDRVARTRLLIRQRPTSDQVIDHDFAMEVHAMCRVEHDGAVSSLAT